jgi:hypothetical protein
MIDSEMQPGQPGQQGLMGHFAEAAPELERAGAELAAAGRTREALAMLLLAADVHGIAGDATAGLVALEAAEPLAAETGDVAALLVARAELLEAAGLGAGKAWQLAAGAASGDGRLRAVRRAVALAVAAGDPAAALDILADELAVTSDPSVAAVLHLERAGAHIAAGAPAAALAELDRLGALDVEVARDGSVRSRELCLRAGLARLEGDLELALAHALEAREAAVSVTDVLAYLPAVAVLADILVAAGREDEAYRVLVCARVSLDDLALPGDELTGPLFTAFSLRLGPRALAVRDALVATLRG